MKRNPKIPSEEDFARARRAMAEANRNLDQVIAMVRSRFSDRCAIYDVYIFPQIDVTFRAIVFFNTNRDIEFCKASGIADEIIDCIYDELDRAGRGKRGEITVAFEFDSDENVKAKFNGDYFLRLR